MEKKKFKICFVDECNNSTLLTPNKIFVTVPRNLTRRILWFEAAGRGLERPASAADLGENSTKRQRTILNTNSSAAFTEHESKASNSPSTSIFETKTFIESQTPVLMNKGIQVKPKYRSAYNQYVCGVQDTSTSPIKSILVNTITSPIKIKSRSTTVKKTLSFSSDLSSITGTSSTAVATTDLSDSLSDENSEVDKEQLTCCLCDDHY
ncbi:hypothetical protein CBL_13841 [Carabus blaptoides fortunei]